jgi:hypothetical protein
MHFGFEMLILVEYPPAATTAESSLFTTNLRAPVPLTSEVLDKKMEIATVRAACGGKNETKSTATCHAIRVQTHVAKIVHEEIRARRRTAGKLNLDLSILRSNRV